MLDTPVGSSVGASEKSPAAGCPFCVVPSSTAFVRVAPCVSTAASAPLPVAAPAVSPMTGPANVPTAGSWLAANASDPMDAPKRAGSVELKTEDPGANGFDPPELSPGMAVAAPATASPDSPFPTLGAILVSSVDSARAAVVADAEALSDLVSAEAFSVASRASSDALRCAGSCLDDPLAARFAAASLPGFAAFSCFSCFSWAARFPADSCSADSCSRFARSFSVLACSALASERLEERRSAGRCGSFATSSSLGAGAAGSSSAAGALSGSAAAASALAPVPSINVMKQSPPVKLRNR